VFEEQYQVVRAEGEKKTVAALLDREKAGAKSVQSPHDPDCHYQNKNGNGTRLFHQRD
jgi:hypothetical protein